MDGALMPCSRSSSRHAHDAEAGHLHERAPVRIELEPDDLRLTSWAHPRRRPGGDHRRADGADGSRAVDATGTVTHFWSRSRKRSWRGETSGHTQHVERMYADCDADAVQVHQDGVVAPPGAGRGFFTALNAEGSANATAPAGMLERPESDDRGSQGVAGVRFIRRGSPGWGGRATICRKIGRSKSRGRPPSEARATGVSSRRPPTSGSIPSCSSVRGAFRFRRCCRSWPGVIASARRLPVAREGPRVDGGLARRRAGDRAGRRVRRESNRQRCLSFIQGLSRGDPW